MMLVTPRADDIVDEAIQWHLRLRDGDEASWNDFVVWLERSPTSNRAYEEVVAADASLDKLVSGRPSYPVAANDEEPRRSGVAQPRRDRRSLLVALALVASLVVAFLGFPLIGTASPIVIYTRAGEQRTVRLDDRTRIVLNGGTRIALDRRNGRFARLERGEASFEVVHDLANPFRVEVGEATLVDVGTAFNVVREGAAVSVEVAEGAVQYRSGSSAVDLAAGQSLENSGNGMLVRRSVDPVRVGSWRLGRLSYRDAPLSRVASDLSRSLGVDVEVVGSGQAPRFTGVIQIQRDEKSMKRQLDALLGVRASRGRAGWLLTPDDRAGR